MEKKHLPSLARWWFMLFMAWPGFCAAQKDSIFISQPTIGASASFNVGSEPSPYLIASVYYNNNRHFVSFGTRIYDYYSRDKKSLGFDLVYRFAPGMTNKSLKFYFAFYACTEKKYRASNGYLYHQEQTLYSFSPMLGFGFDLKFGTMFHLLQSATIGPKFNRDIQTSYYTYAPNDVKEVDDDFISDKALFYINLGIGIDILK